MADQSDLAPIEGGCLEAAFEKLGYRVRVYRNGLVVDKATRDFASFEALLDALPLAHGLHIALAGKSTPVFQATLKCGAKCALFSDPERVGELFDDGGHEDVDLLKRAAARSILFAQQHKMPRPIFATAVRGLL